VRRNGGEDPDSVLLLAAIETLTPTEREVFFRGLVKMIRALQERGEVPISRMSVTCRFCQPNAHPNSAGPYHRAFVDAPFGGRDLRLDCADHEPSAAEQTASTWQQSGATS
jgi:hypothetical protein